MTLHTLNSQNTVLNKFIAQIRDKSIQTDSMRFRRNLERIGRNHGVRDFERAVLYAPRGRDSAGRSDRRDDRRPDRRGDDSASRSSLPSGFSELLRRCGERVCFGLP